ncbi:MAG: 3-deoxy-D-manno-octulosonic acid transferase [Mariprofundaceae bacterium]|nr:3-deoxy-D-manno-octulosonic acid transferase [Mariprofundaceae bacterium]
MATDSMALGIWLQIPAWLPLSQQITRSERWQQQWLWKKPQPLPDCVWVHACSVGEVASVVPLINLLLNKGQSIHLTVVTRTGMAHAQRLWGGAITTSFLPWDLPGFMRYFVTRVQPSLLLLTETEFWPGMLAACAAKNIPVLGINTRISDRSFPRYYATRWLWQRWLAPVNRFLAQSMADAERLQAIGIEKTRICTVGNLKYAITAPKVNAMALRLRMDQTGERPILLCASTHEHEEMHILRMLPYWRRQRPDLLTVFVPRHPERFDAVAMQLTAHGERVHRWQHGYVLGAVDTVLVDAMGVLQSLYTVADLVIIGGSLVNIGGHNPIEAAVCGRGVVMGAYHQNFRDMVNNMKAAQAIMVANDHADLQAIVLRLLQFPDELRLLHASAALFMQQHGEVLTAMMQEITPYLHTPKQ